MKNIATNNKAGFALVEMLSVVIVIGVMGFVGWRVWSAQQTGSVASTTTPVATTQAATAIKVPAIKDASGLSSVESTLNTTVLDDTTLNDLDKALDF